MRTLGKIANDFNSKQGKSYKFAGAHLRSNQFGSSNKVMLFAGVLLLLIIVGGMTIAMVQPTASQDSISAADLTAASIPIPIITSLANPAPSGKSVVTSLSSNTLSSSQPTSVSTNINNGNASVTVNGQTVNLPKNGSLNKTITSSNGSKTNVSITVQNNGSSSTSSTSSSVNVNSFNSSSTSDTNSTAITSQ